MIFILFIAGLGLIVGSFLNALIYRLNTEESVLKGRSHCIDCSRVLTWYELVPVFSFIAQKGRCRGCGEKISIQYPLVEISTAMLFLQISNFKFQISNGLSFEMLAEIVFLWFIVGGLLVIFVYDLKHYLIPDKILVPLIFVVLFAELFGIWHLDFMARLSAAIPAFGLGIWYLEFGILDLGSVFNGLALAVLSVLPFALMHFLSKGRAMGFGDVKLAFFMGLFLGYPAVLTAMFIAFLMGAIIGMGLMVLGRSTMKSRVPFGPFLVAGTLMALFWSESLSSWYINLFY
ncbi:MAG: prepilin peptidase [Candidatus Spechtbacterales bacterium]